MRSPWSALDKRTMILDEPIQTMRRRVMAIAVSQTHPSLNESWNGIHEIQIHLPTFLVRLPSLVGEDRRPRKA